MTIQRVAAVSILCFLASVIGCGKDDPAGPAPAKPRTLAFSLQPGIRLTNLFSMAAGDFNNDGRVDLAASSSDSLLLYILIGKGDGTFQAPRLVTYPDSLGSAADVFAGDFDSDGNDDLVCNTTGTTHTVFLFGNGDGTFGVHPLDGDRGPFTQGQAAVGDFDGDGIGDYASVRGDSVAAILGDTGRSMPRIVSVTFGGPTTNGSVNSVAADFDGDGKIDFAVPRISENRVAVYYGWGDGTFQTPIMLASSGWSYRCCVTKPVPARAGSDIAVTHALGGVVGVFRRSAGTFLAESTYVVGANPSSVGAADFDIDGREDLAVSSGGTNSAAILRGKTDGLFMAPLFFNAGSSPNHLIVSDYDGDSLPDIAVSGFHAIYVLLNRSK